MKIIFAFCLLLLFASCSSPSFDYAIMGADEFVIDSYKIRQGKFAILEMEGYDIEDLPCSAMEEYKDEIAEDDILNLALYHPTRNDLVESIQFINQTVGGFKVVHGSLDIPDIGSIYVSRLTLEQARWKIQFEFNKQIKDAEVFLTYRDRLIRKVELAGLTAVSTVPVDGKIRLYDVLSRARIPPEANLFMSYVMRDGKPLAIDLHKLINQGDMDQNIVMCGGDKIYIAAASDAKIMLTGEVGEPCIINLPYGFISLREAIVKAQGIPFTGDKDRIQIIRGNLLCPKIYMLSWQHIIHLPNESLLLMPGDTVYVSARPITQWNRFISQLFPSLDGLQNGYEIYRILQRIKN